MQVIYWNVLCETLLHVLGCCTMTFKWTLTRVCDSGWFCASLTPSWGPSQRFLHCFRALESTSSHAEGGDAYSPSESLQSSTGHWVNQDPTTRILTRIQSTRVIQNPASPSVSLSPAASLPTAQQKVIEKTRLRDRRLGRKTHAGQ